ncbi:hypothetical protein Pmar_PMAR027407, partial [Perkinsus marinus ATCC 50983]
ILNVRADGLSRLLERRCGTLSPTCSLGKVLQDHLDSPKASAGIVDDLICRLGDLPPTIDGKIVHDRLCRIS